MSFFTERQCDGVAVFVTERQCNGVAVFVTERQCNGIAVWGVRSCLLYGTHLPVRLQVITSLPQPILHLGLPR